MFWLSYNKQLAKLFYQKKLYKITSYVNLHTCTQNFAFHIVGSIKYLKCMYVLCVIVIIYLQEKSAEREKESQGAARRNQEVPISTCMKPGNVWQDTYHLT